MNRADHWPLLRCTYGQQFSGLHSLSIRFLWHQLYVLLCPETCPTLLSSMELDQTLPEFHIPLVSPCDSLRLSQGARCSWPQTRGTRAGYQSMVSIPRSSCDGRRHQEHLFGHTSSTLVINRIIGEKTLEEWEFRCPALCDLRKPNQTKPVHQTPGIIAEKFAPRLGMHKHT